jgi:hypothetical protein
MSNLFSKAFFKVINEQDEIPVAQQDVDAMSDADAMASTLDQGTKPEDFDVNAGTREASLASAKSHAMMVDVLEQWISKVRDFSEFLNGQGGKSVQTMLSTAAEKSIFGVIKTAESKKIAIVAKELAGLNEMLKGYLADASNPKYLGS